MGYTFFGVIYENGEIFNKYSNNDESQTCRKLNAEGNYSFAKAWKLPFNFGYSAQNSS